MHLAAFYGNAQTIRLLLASGANAERGRTPLMRAQGHLKCAQLLGGDAAMGRNRQVPRPVSMTTDQTELVDDVLASYEAGPKSHTLWTI